MGFRERPERATTLLHYLRLATPGEAPRQAPLEKEKCPSLILQDGCEEAASGKKEPFGRDGFAREACAGEPGANSPEFSQPKVSHKRVFSLIC